MSDAETAPRYPGEMGERLARLEQIAATTAEAIGRLDRAIERLESRVDRLDEHISSRLARELGASPSAD